MYWAAVKKSYDEIISIHIYSLGPSIIKVKSKE